MSIQIHISVFDVDCAPVNGCQFKIAYTSATNKKDVVLDDRMSGNTHVANVADSISGWTVVVDGYPHYFPETTVIRKDKTWVNATSTLIFSTQPGGDESIAVEVVLSRVRLAPTVEYPGDIRQFRGSPGGVLTTSGNQFAYQHMNAGVRENFHVLQEKIIGDPGADNWGRLKHQITKRSDPLSRGRFRWIEHGPEKKYVIAVWIPHYDAWSPGPLDFIVFYPPTTKKKDAYNLDAQHTYPYGLKTHPNGQRTQPYIVELGHKYLFDRLHLTFQLVAVQKKAIIVLPINNQGDYGSLTHKDGIHRLLLEVAHFVRKGMLPPSQGPGTHIPIPSIRRVIVTGFSSGIDPITKLFAEQKSRSGPSYVKNQANKFDELWKEIWDLDLAFKASGEPWVGYYKSFLANRPDRRVRMYHSQYTLGPTDAAPNRKWRPGDHPDLKKLIAAAGNNGLNQQILKQSNNPKEKPDILVEEYHLLDKRWTIAYFSEDYLRRVEITENPEPMPPYGWGDQHDFTVNIGFAHAARLSDLDKLK